MEAYIKFTQIFLSGFGILQLRGKQRKFNKIFNTSALVTSACAIVQTFVYLVLGQGDLSDKSLGLIMCAFLIQSFGKLLALTSNREKLRELFDLLDDMHREMDAVDKVETERFVKKMLRTNVAMVRFYIFTVTLFMIKPIVLMIFSFISY